MAFLIYNGKVALALLVFYLFYHFLLKKETFHRFNRVVLVGTAVLSFLLPLCIITIHKPIEVTPVVPEPAIVATELPAQELTPLVEPAVPWWPIALIVLFWAGVVLVLARVSISIFSIVRIIRRGQLVREDAGCQIIVTERDINPFSWMKYIVLSREDWEAPHESILSHEKAHVGLKHSWERLLVDILSCLQWFNPAIWMLRADLQELHEYEADDAVLRAGTNIKEYQYLLIRKVVSKSGYSVANNFNHSILKNRITMMSKSKSKSPLSRGLRALYLLPLVCLGLGLQARTVYVPSDKDSNNILADERNPNNPEKTVTIKIESDGRIIIDGKETPLKEIAGYLRSLDVPVQNLQFNVDTDDAPEEVIRDFQLYFEQAFHPTDSRIVHVNIDAKGKVTVDGKDVAKKDILSHFLSLGTPAKDIIVQLLYDNDTPRGVVDDVVNVLGLAGVIWVQTAATAQTVYVPTGKDNDNLQEGFKLNVENDDYKIILREAWGEEKEITMAEFEKINRNRLNRIKGVEVIKDAETKAKLGFGETGAIFLVTMKRPQELDEISVISYTDEEDEEIPFMLANPETMPSFQGEEMSTFTRWLNARINRPKGCTHEGDMKVSFVVGTDGTVKDVKVVSGVCETLDALVLSIIEQSPKWKPATANGHPVEQCLMIPIEFRIR
ncbi:MAG: energy transducer TonB [Bacteroidales bacterium]|nr:energy transducer TonB [Bacteroidales bacterium]